MTWSGRWVQIASKFATTCAIDSAGHGFCWGDNVAGAVGNPAAGGYTRVPYPVSTSGVLSGRRLVMISPGIDHTCALDSTGLAFCWGANGSGQLGNNTRITTSVPVAVSTANVLAGKVLTSISAGVASTCAIDSTGKTYCWGAQGALGTTLSHDSVVPVAVNRAGVLAGKPVTQVDVSRYGNLTSTMQASAACVVSKYAVAYCWQAYGLPAALPTGLPATAKVKQISVDDQTCVLTTTGKVYCWGANDFGQLGTGNLADTAAPTPVSTAGALSGRTVAQITTGDFHTCFLDTAGLAYCTGSNYTGELGTGTPASSTVPVAVSRAGALAGRTLVSISAGDGDVCALDSAGRAYCWGSNTNGELGDGLTGNSPVPVAVSTPVTL